MSNSPSRDKVKTNKKLQRLLGVDDNVLEKNDALVEYKIQTKNQERIEAELKKLVHAALTNSGDKFHVEDTNDNILYFENTNGKLQDIKGATIEKLIEKLTSVDDVVDLIFIDDFLLTFPTFITPIHLLELMIERFNIQVPSTIDNTNIDDFNLFYCKPIQLKIISIIKKWIEDNYYYFYQDNSLVLLCTNFINNNIKTSFQTLSQNMLKAITLHVNDITINTNNSNNSNNNITIPPSIEPDMKMYVQHPLLSFDPTEVARQITLIEMELFKKIKSNELLNTNWMKKEKEIKSINVVKMIQTFNHLAHFVKYSIVSNNEITIRMEYIKQWIEVANKLKEIHNFNGVVSILGGLGSVAVHRLKKTWNLVPSNTIKIYQELTTIAAPELNYNNLRVLIKSPEVTGTTCLPYLGMYLTDLNFLEEAFSNTINIVNNINNSNSILINFEKRKKQASIIKEIRTLQQSNYYFAIQPIIRNTIVKGSNFTDDEQCYQLSLQHEPKESSNEDYYNNSNINNNKQRSKLTMSDSSSFLSNSNGNNNERPNIFTRSMSSVNMLLNKKGDTFKLSKSSSMSDKDFKLMSISYDTFYTPPVSSDTLNDYNSTNNSTNKNYNNNNNTEEKEIREMEIEEQIKVPDELKDIIEDMFKLVNYTFSGSISNIKNNNIDKSKDKLFINGERYMLLRIGTLSGDLYSNYYLKNNGNLSNSNTKINDLFYDLFFKCGKTDAKDYISLTCSNIKNNNESNNSNKTLKEQIISGFIMLNCKGLITSINIEEWKVTDIDNMFISFTMKENLITKSVRKMNGKSTSECCTVICGYIAGWIHYLVNNNVTIVSIEIKCRGRGHDNCYCIVGSISQINNYLNKMSIIKDRIPFEYGKGIINYKTYYDQIMNDKKSNSTSLSKSISGKQKKLKKITIISSQLQQIENAVLGPLFQQLKINKQGEILLEGLLEEHQSTVTLIKPINLFTGWNNEFIQLIGNININKNDDGLQQFSNVFVFELLNLIGNVDQYITGNLIRDETSNILLCKLLPLKTFVAALGMGYLKFNFDSFKVNKTNDQFYVEIEVFNSIESKIYDYTSSPQCIGLCGYITGWCQNIITNTNDPIIATEVTCKCLGLDSCHIIVSNVSTIHGNIENWLENNNLRSFSQSIMKHLHVLKKIVC